MHGYGILGSQNGHSSQMLPGGHEVHMGSNGGNICRTAPDFGREMSPPSLGGEHGVSHQLNKMDAHQQHSHLPPPYIQPKLSAPPPEPTGFQTRGSPLFFPFLLQLQLGKGGHAGQLAERWWRGGNQHQRCGSKNHQWTEEVQHPHRPFSQSGFCAGLRALCQTCLGTPNLGGNSSLAVKPSRGCPTGYRSQSFRGWLRYVWKVKSLRLFSWI